MTMSLPSLPPLPPRPPAPDASRPREALRAFVLQTVHPDDRLRLERDGLDDETALFAEGLLDSGAVLELVLLLEELCGRPVEAADIGQGALASIGAMMRAFFGHGPMRLAAQPSAAETAAEHGEAEEARATRFGDGKPALARDACVHDLGGGRVALTGPAAAWIDELDAALVRMAVHRGAERVRLPPLLDVESLARVGYFRSFPHLAVLAGPAGGGAEATRRIGAGRRDVAIAHACAWTPAACYPLYPWLGDRPGRLPETPLAEERSLEDGRRAALFTVHATCARWEGTDALRRQTCFDMREIVAVGPRAAVEAEMEAFCRLVGGLARELGLEPRWSPASDPFFEPEAVEGALQAAEGLKIELVVDGCAIASRNFHRGRFVRAFGIGRAAWQSACGAVGLERWLGAVIGTHGHDPRRWPCPREAMARALAHEGGHG